MKRLLKVGFPMAITIVLLIVSIMGVLTSAIPPTISTKERTKTSYVFTTKLVMPNNQTDIWVHRKVFVSEFLYVKVVDMINITNTKDNPISGLKIIYPARFFDRISSLYVLGSYKNGTPEKLDYTLAYETSDYISIIPRFHVYLDKYSPVDKNSYMLYIIFEMLPNTIYSVAVGNKMFLVLNISPAPFLPYHVLQYTIDIKKPDVASIDIEADRTIPSTGRQIINDQIVRYTKKNLKPFSMVDNLTQAIKSYGFDSEISVVWSTTNATPIIKYAERTIEISESHTMKITDHLKVSAYALTVPEDTPQKTPLALYSFKVGLAPNISNIKVRDNVDDLKYYNTTDSDINETIHVISVDLSSRPIIPGDIRDIYISYEIKLDEKFLSEENNTFIAYIPLAPVINYSYSVFRLNIKSSLPVRLVLPVSFDNSLYEVSIEKFFTVIYTIAHFSLENLLPSNNKMMKILIDYDPVPLLRTYLIIALYTIIVSALVLEISLILRIVSKKYVKPEVQKEYIDLERFIKDYETIVAYDKNAWGEAYESFIVKRPTPQALDDFKKKAQSVSSKYERILPRINKLKNISEIYEKLVELEKIEELINLTKIQIQNVVRDYLSGKIPNDIYLQRIEGLLLDLKDLINRRERIINSVRDYYLSLI